MYSNHTAPFLFVLPPPLRGSQTQALKQGEKVKKELFLRIVKHVAQRAGDDADDGDVRRLAWVGEEGYGGVYGVEGECLFDCVAGRDGWGWGWG